MEHNVSDSSESVCLLLIIEIKLHRQVRVIAEDSKWKVLFTIRLPGCRYVSVEVNFRPFRKAFRKSRKQTTTRTVDNRKSNRTKRSLQNVVERVRAAITSGVRSIGYALTVSIISLV